jgi:hypothetical protein
MAETEQAPREVEQEIAESLKREGEQWKRAVIAHLGRSKQGAK